VARPVAASGALRDNKHRPVVVMVPPSLKDKWPRDFSMFRECCAKDEASRRLVGKSADSAVSFLKLLDDPPERRASLIFLTHGAMRMGGGARRAPGSWAELVERNPDRWRGVIRRYGVDPEHDDDASTDDDPVPAAVMHALRETDLGEVFERLSEIPRRESSYIDERLQSLRQKLDEAIREIWQKCLRRHDFRLPLLILDEAHHLKNPHTRFASLFQDEDASEDAAEVSGGPLNGVFERMLFLTATPFQLGHHELCSVLELFGAVSWSGDGAPQGGKEAFVREQKVLRQRLDAAQEAPSPPPNRRAMPRVGGRRPAPNRRQALHRPWWGTSWKGTGRRFARCAARKKRCSPG